MLDYPRERCEYENAMLKEEKRRQSAKNDVEAEKYDEEIQLMAQDCQSACGKRGFVIPKDELIWKHNVEHEEGEIREDE